MRADESSAKTSPKSHGRWLPAPLPEYWPRCMHWLRRLGPFRSTLEWYTRECREQQGAYAEYVTRCGSSAGRTPLCTLVQVLDTLILPPIHAIEVR